MLNVPLNNSVSTTKNSDINSGWDTGTMRLVEFLFLIKLFIINFSMPRFDKL